jgi:hypothetical protein
MCIGLVRVRCVLGFSSDFNGLLRLPNLLPACTPTTVIEWEERWSSEKERCRGNSGKGNYERAKEKRGVGEREEGR